MRYTKQELEQQKNHAPGGGHEEGGVGGAARGGDHLAASSVDGLARHDGVEDLREWEKTWQKK